MESNFEIVANAMLAGNVAPFLGAGVNLWAGRVPPDRPPSAAELARQLAGPGPPADPLDLLRVSQFVETMRGSGPLYQKLRMVFNVKYQTTPLHQLLAGLPKQLRDTGVAAPLMVTTNYDQVLEDALCDAGEEFDQIVYIANKLDRDFGRFRHVKWRQPADPSRAIAPASSQVIPHANEYHDADLSAGRFPIVLKIHGAVDTAAANDSYVITEDDYIEYIAHSDASTLLPAFIGERLKDCHILFLGYGLRDWNLRVLLRRIWGNRRFTWNSWAIQKDCEEVDRRFWQRHDVELIEMRLEEYTEKLRQQLDSLVRTPPGQ